MNTQIADWRVDFGDNLNVDRLKEIFTTSDHFRVEGSQHPSGARRIGAMMRAKCFVFEGSITFEYVDKSIQILANQYASLPAGSYRFSVDSLCLARFALVWKLE